MRSALLFALAAAACNKSAPAPAPSEGPVPAATTSPAAASEPKLLAEGASAPEIEAEAHTGQKIKLSDFRGKPVVVYFYPKDDTPGCTVEAEGIRDDWDELSQLNAVVLGVSTQDNESHKAFAKKYNLPFLLLPDTDETIAAAFGVPVKNGYTKRVTFVIDKQGKIAKVFPEVTPKGHSAEILAAIEG